MCFVYVFSEQPSYVFIIYGPYIAVVLYIFKNVINW